jgi:citrate lyase subunit beta/citryl-CoA lyase
MVDRVARNDRHDVSGSVRVTTASSRSWLFVPCNRAERFEKARSASADAVILDLGDAVTLGE